MNASFLDTTHRWLGYQLNTLFDLHAGVRTLNVTSSKGHGDGRGVLADKGGFAKIWMPSEENGSDFLH